jgi:protein gp37
MDKTKIEWTDATWNVVNGCSVVSPGCTNCYAMRLAGTRLKHHASRAGLTIDTKAGPVWTGETRFDEKVLLQPLKWRRPRRIFVCAHGDLFHESVSDDVIDRVFAVMALAPRHQFQVLTKRPARMREYLSRPDVSVRVGMEALGLCCESAANGGTLGKGVVVKATDINPGALKAWPLPNVWLGVSVEDQVRADERIPLLLDTPADVRWLSCEPLLGPIDLTRVMAIDTPARHTDQERWGIRPLLGRYGIRMHGCGPGDPDWLDGNGNPYPKIDWVVAGGESGPGARPMHPDWARSLRDQCDAAGVAFLFKQWGEFGPDEGPNDDFDRDGFRRDRVMEGAGPCAAWLGDHWRFADDGYRMPIDLPGDDHEWVYRLGKKRNGRLLDGQMHDGFPA